MKRLLALLAVAGIFSLTACSGGTKEETSSEESMEQTPAGGEEPAQAGEATTDSATAAPTQ